MVDMGGEEHDYKEIICQECYRVSRVSKHVPIRFHWCLGCGSLNIRLYKGNDSDDEKWSQKGEDDEH